MEYCDRVLSSMQSIISICWRPPSFRPGYGRWLAQASKTPQEIKKGGASGGVIEILVEQAEYSL